MWKKHHVLVGLSAIADIAAGKSSIAQTEGFDKRDAKGMIWFSLPNAFLCVTIFQDVPRFRPLSIQVRNEAR
jgi:hypothetical protein